MSERRLRERLEATLESLEDGFVAIDRNWRITYVNAAAETVQMRSRAELLGRDAREIYPEASRFFELCEEAMRDGVPFRIEGEYPPRGLVLEVRGFPTPDGLSIYFRDVTARHRLAEDYLRRAEELGKTEKALREAVEQLGVVTQTMSVAVTRCSRDLRYLWVSRVYADWLHLAPEQIAGRDIREVIGPEGFATILPYIERVLSGETVEYEAPVHFASRGLRWISAVYTPERDAAGVPVGWVAVIHDVTERRRLEGDLLDANRRKDEFLAMLGHELRNPIGAIANAVEALRGPAGPSRLEWARGILERQTAHVTRVVDDLLDVSRITSGRLRVVKRRIPVAAAVRTALDSVQPSVLARRQEILVSEPEESLVVDADLHRLAQVLSNLLANASKYSPEGSRIRLEVSREGDEVVFTVRDEGIGIPPETLPHVFELFAQGAASLDRSQRGLGIGLTVVERLVRKHGGRVEAASEGAGRGSVFTVRLPIASGPAEPEPRRERASQAPPLEARRVLIVDDSVDFAQGLAQIVQSSGHEVRTAGGGSEALDLLVSFRPDVVLMDVGMPGLDGYEAARRMRARPEGERALLVAVTGYGQDSDVLRALEAGFDRHLTKPVRPAAVLDLVDESARVT